VAIGAIQNNARSATSGLISVCVITIALKKTYVKTACNAGRNAATLVVQKE